jgi:hypothetical protein
MAWMSSRDQRWTALYQELLELLERFGKDHPSGEGDFWLVDDDWGGQHHKICIANQKFWSDDVKYSIQNILKKNIMIGACSLFMMITQKEKVLLFTRTI